jgi:hypothetical protein
MISYRMSVAFSHLVGITGLLILPMATVYSFQISPVKAPDLPRRANHSAAAALRSAKFLFTMQRLVLANSLLRGTSWNRNNRRPASPLSRRRRSRRSH